MKKYIVLLGQMLVLLWFALDMTGAYFGENCLVTRSYKEDGIFFLLYLATIILFIKKEKIGKWLVSSWLSIWLLVELLSHEWYTLFGKGIMGTAEGKINYFADTITWIQIEGTYVPDLYHIILHLLILIALTLTIIYMARQRMSYKAQPSELQTIR